MTELTIKTNGHYRNLLSWYEIPIKDQEYFLSLMELEGLEDSDYFSYKGTIYFLGDFMAIDCNNPLSDLGYDGYLSDSFFSGIIIKYDKYDYNSIQVATYLS